MLAMVKGVMQSLGGANQTNQGSSRMAPLTKMENGSPANPGLTGLMFPSDLETQAFWIDFSPIKRTRKKRTDAPEKSILGHIYLPLPANLNDAYQSNYDQQGLGLLGEWGRNAPDVAANLIEGFKEGGKEGVSRIFDLLEMEEAGALAVSALKYEGARMASNPAATGAAVAALTGSSALGAAGVGLGSVLRGAMVDEGIATNPFLAQVFTGVNLRSHNFTFKLVPKSVEESKVLRSMILSFKRNMLPSHNIESKLGTAIMGGSDLGDPHDPDGDMKRSGEELDSAAARSLFSYPNEWKLQFSPNIAHNMYKINPCVLTNVAVQYHGENKAFYFEDRDGHGNFPMSINLSLSFMETQIQTREDIIDMQSAAEVNRLEQAGKALDPETVAAVTLVESPHRDASGKPISRLKARSLGIIK